MVPACTHYSIITDEIEAYFNNEMEVVDAPKIVAQQVKQALQEQSLLSNNKNAELHFMVSDLTPSFQKSAAIFFGKKVSLEEKRLV